MIHLIHSVISFMRKLNRWARFTDGIAGSVSLVLTPIVQALVHIEPLPRSTNVPLICLGCLIWAFAGAISFWGDSRAFVATGVILIGVCGAVILCAQPAKADGA